MVVTKESRIDRTYREWFGDNEENIATYRKWVKNGKFHMYDFARRFVKMFGDLDIFSGVTEWVWSKPSEVWAARIEGSLYEMLDKGEGTKVVTITNPYYESILVVQQWLEHFAFDVDGDEPISDDSDYRKTIIIGPRQTFVFDQGMLANGGVLVPYILSLNGGYSEIPKTYYDDLDQYPQWKAYFKETDLKVEKLDEWTPSMDFWVTGGEVPLYSATDGKVIESQYDEYTEKYGDFIPTAETPPPPPPPPPEEETDYTMWVIIGIMIVVTIIIYFTMVKKRSPTDG